MIAISSEVDSNPGFSVTNGAEYIREAALLTFPLLREHGPKNITWIEHYPNRDGFDLVKYDQNGLNPTWATFTREALEALLTPLRFEPIEQTV